MTDHLSPLSYFTWWGSIKFANFHKQAQIKQQEIERKKKQPKQLVDPFSIHLYWIQIYAISFSLGQLKIKMYSYNIKDVFSSIRHLLSYINVYYTYKES